MQHARILRYTTKARRRASRCSLGRNVVRSVVDDDRPDQFEVTAVVEDATAAETRGIVRDHAPDKPEAGEFALVHQAAAMLGRGIVREGAPQDRQVPLAVRSPTKPTKGRLLRGSEQTSRGIRAKVRVADERPHVRGAEEEPTTERAEGLSARGIARDGTARDRDFAIVPEAAAVFRRGVVGHRALTDIDTAQKVATPPPIPTELEFGVPPGTELERRNPE